VLEFEHAKYGMTGLETAYAVIQTLFPTISPLKIYDLFGGKARKIFKLDQPKIEKDAAALLTVFSPQEKWQFIVARSKSKSENSAFGDHIFTGKPKAIIRRDQLFIND
jgi:dihydroorotase